MSYLEINRGKFGGQKMPNDVVRLHKNLLVISPNIAERYQSYRYTTEAGRGGMKFGLAVDLEAKRIKLIPNAINGFSFNEATRTDQGSAMYCARPVALKRIPMPIGDYQLIDERTLEFQLAT